MKPIKVISLKVLWQACAILAFLVIYATIETILSGAPITEALQAAFWGSLILIITVLLMYVFIIRGRSLEISSEGLNMGKRYQGPYSVSSQVTAYTIPKHRSEDLSIPWGQIVRVSFGTWERFWSRHWNILTPLLSGDINDASQSQQIAQVFGVPATRLKAFFLIIHTKENEFYALDMNTRMARQVKNAIQKFGYGNLIDAQTQNI